MPDIVDELRSAMACTQRTFRHMPDWKDGRRILLEAASEIERLRNNDERLAATFRKVASRYGCDGTDTSNHISDAFNEIAKEIEAKTAPPVSRPKLGGADV